MYKARVYHIMIGAPSDIKEEVEILKKVVHKWNDLNSEKEKIVLLPKHWASSTYPTAGARPQESINKQIVDKSDLLISIFGARLGAPTGKASSGSIEEIDEHLKAGKPVMVFFKKSGSYDIDPAQLQLVLDYKKSIQDHVLWVEYRDEEEFSNIILDKIQLFLNDNWLKEKDEDEYYDEEILRGADRAVSSAQSTAQFNEYVKAMSILFASLQEVLTCKDKKRAVRTIGMLVSFIHEILDVRSKQGKCRVTKGKREQYIKLIQQTGNPDANAIIRLLKSAEEVSEDYHEIDDLFDEKIETKIEAKIEETIPKWESVDAGTLDDDAAQAEYDRARGK